MVLENEKLVFVGIKMNALDVKNLKIEAKEKRTSLSGLIREKIFR